MLALAAATVAALGAAGPAAAQSAVSTPSDKTLYRTGHSGRFLMDGPWLYRADQGGAGDRELFQRQTTTAGWSPTTVPNAWNATDESDASFMGGVGWYRKDFRLPRGGRSASWVVRFESVNYRSRVWLNGRPIGSNRGAYLPFEIRLPRSVLRRGLVNRLVIRVDSRRKQTDFPPSGLSVTGRPTGGWWNYGGLLREVYLRRIDDIDLTTAIVRPDLPCALCPATVDYRVVLRNYGERARRVRVTARFGARRVSARHARRARAAVLDVHAAHQRPPPAAVVAGHAEPLRRDGLGDVGAPHAAALRRRDRHPLDPRRARRPDAPQRRAR